MLKTRDHVVAAICAAGLTLNFNIFAFSSNFLSSVFGGMCCIWIWRFFNDYSWARKKQNDEEDRKNKWRTH